MTICEDNQAVIAMAATDRITRRSKHIDIRYHVTKDAVTEKRVDLPKI